tara:strand:+ start:2657 stop:2845 length:189 start_codon:yes stop_codon:yes gene_type:complete
MGFGSENGYVGMILFSILMVASFPEQLSNIKENKDITIGVFFTYQYNLKVQNSPSKLFNLDL